MNINTQSVHTIDEMIYLIGSSASLDVQLRDHAGNLRTVTLIPQDGKIGTMIGYSNLRLNTGATLEKFGVIEAARMASQETYASSMLTFRLLGKTL